jgi:hypothetical protein
MTGKRNWLGMLVMILAFGMAIAGCDTGTGSSSSSDNGSGNGDNNVEDTGTVRIIANKNTEYGVSFHLTTSDVFSSPISFKEGNNTLTSKDLIAGQTYTFTVPVTAKCISFNGGARAITVVKGKTTTVTYDTVITIENPDEEGPPVDNNTGTVRIIANKSTEYGVSFHLTTSDVFSSPISFKEGNNTLTSKDLIAGQTYTFTVPVTAKCISFNAGARAITIAGGKTTTVTYDTVITIGNPE